MNFDDTSIEQLEVMLALLGEDIRGSWSYVHDRLNTYDEILSELYSRHPDNQTYIEEVNFLKEQIEDFVDGRDFRDMSNFYGKGDEYCLGFKEVQFMEDALENPEYGRFDRIRKRILGLGLI